jgi:hypothetical protein
MPAIDLIHELREHAQDLAILYLAKPGSAGPELEARLPLDVRILPEPFTVDELRAALRPFLLPRLQVTSGSRTRFAPRRKRP